MWQFAVPNTGTKPSTPSELPQQQKQQSNCCQDTECPRMEERRSRSIWRVVSTRAGVQLSLNCIHRSGNAIVCRINRPPEGRPV
mmetsp:Transcript_1332/g.3854  ORF Transcript_1332/g.3854 Transcript_1332/m.3854 type:complete len:84 (+) Transcript_1332:245-496(+)